MTKVDGEGGIEVKMILRSLNLNSIKFMTFYEDFMLRFIGNVVNGKVGQILEKIFRKF